VAPPGNQAENGENKLQPIAMEGPGLLDNKEFRMLKYGIARAAQAPRVARSFLVGKNDRIPYFDIHYSVFIIRY